MRVVVLGASDKPSRYSNMAVGFLLRKGHEDVSLSDEELRCLATWMDANALFYGTFDPEDQKRQQRGERIAGPALE